MIVCGWLYAHVCEHERVPIYVNWHTIEGLHACDPKGLVGCVYFCVVAEGMPTGAYFSLYVGSAYVPV